MTLRYRSRCKDDQVIREKRRVQKKDMTMIDNNITSKEVKQPSIEKKSEA
jgi:hypothetical protein